MPDRALGQSFLQKLRCRSRQRSAYRKRSPANELWLPQAILTLRLLDELRAATILSRLRHQAGKCPVSLMPINEKLPRPWQSANILASRLVSAPRRGGAPGEPAPALRVLE